MTAPGPAPIEDYGILMPWMPQELINVYNEAYIEYGDPELAWAAVRQAPEYDRYFAGNRRDDGTLRMSEQEYMSVKDGYDDVFVAIGLNPRLFKEKYIDLIEGDVSPDELMRDRVQPVYDRVIDVGPAMVQQYADDWGLEMTPEAILAAALDPDDIGHKILTRQISMSEIGMEAAESGYELDMGFVEQIYNTKKIDKAGADRLFQSAENAVPVLSALAARHEDPDDDFNIDDFVSAELFADPAQRRRMRRLVKQEASLFTGGGQIDYVRSRSGGVAGLSER